VKVRNRRNLGTDPLASIRVIDPLPVIRRMSPCFISVLSPQVRHVGRRDARRRAAKARGHV